jgi:hypothetical protein
MYGQRVAALFKPSGDGIYVVSVDTIRFLRRNGAKISDSVVRVLPGSRSIESFAVKSDTTIVMYQASDSMTVLVGNSSSARSLQPWERAGRFNQFSDGSVVYVSTYNRVYIQHSSLESGFRDFTSQIPIPALTAHGTGSIESALTLVFAGYNSRQNPDTIIVSRIGPTRDGRYVLVRQAIPSISIGTITLHDDTVYTLSGNGKVIRHTETSLDSSESIIPDQSSSTFAHANVLRIDGITRSLRAYSKEIGYRCLLYTEQEVTEPFVSESIDFRDSIGELHQLLGDEQNGFTASGSKCIAFSASLLGPWRRTLQVKGGNIFRLGDGGMVASLKGNAIGLSEDTGKSWSIHYVKGMFGGFVQAVESKDFLALNRRSELYIVPRYLVGDTVERYQYTPVYGNDLSILGMQGDTAYLIHPRFEDAAMQSVNRFVLLHVSRLGVLDSVVIQLERPLVSHSRVTARLINDTIVVYDRVSSRFMLIKNGSLVFDSTLSDNLRDPFSRTPLATVQILSTNHVRIILPSNGIAADIFPLGKDNTVSVTDQNISHWDVSAVYPNPGSMTVSVDISKFVTADQSGVTLKLCSIEGRIERDYTSQLPSFGGSNEVRSISLDVSDIPQGVYLLVIRNAQNTSARKLIVDR